MTNLTRTFAALSDPTRLGLVEALVTRGELPAGMLAAEAHVSAPAVSRHLKVLREARIVRDLREGRHVRYELATRASWPREAREWVDRLDHGLGGVPGPAAARTPATPAPPPSLPRPAADLEDYLL